MRLQRKDLFVLHHIVSLSKSLALTRTKKIKKNEVEGRKETTFCSFPNSFSSSPSLISSHPIPFSFSFGVNHHRSMGDSYEISTEKVGFNLLQQFTFLFFFFFKAIQVN